MRSPAHYSHLLNPFEWGPLLAFQKRQRMRYYERCLHDRSFAERTLARYLPAAVLRRRGHALDVGCGDGRISAMLHQLGFSVIGLDIAPTSLWFQHRGAKFVVASAESIPFPDATFDLCTSFLALGYVPDDHQAIAEMARVLKPGGTLLLQLTNRRNLYSLCHGKLLDPQHRREYTADDIERLLAGKFTITRQWAEKVYLPFFTRFGNYCYELLLGDRLKRLVTRAIPAPYRGYLNAVAVKS